MREQEGPPTHWCSPRVRQPTAAPSAALTASRMRSGATATRGRRRHRKVGSSPALRHPEAAVDESGQARVRAGPHVLASGPGSCGSQQEPSLHTGLLTDVDPRSACGVARGVVARWPLCHVRPCDERGFVCGAELGCLPAACPKPATGWRVDWTRGPRRALKKSILRRLGLVACARGSGGVRACRVRSS